jgi:hypothetical protein
MKFVVDVQLPYGLKLFLKDNGHFLFKNNFKIVIELLSKHSLIELNSFEITGK